MNPRRTNLEGSSPGPSWLQPLYFAWGLLFICLALLNVSKAVASIATGGLAAMALWQYLKDRQFPLKGKRVAWAMAAIWIIACLAFFWTDDQARWMKDVREKLPLFVIPIALWILPAFPPKMWRALLWIFLIGQVVLSLISLGPLVLDYEATVFLRDKLID